MKKNKTKKKKRENVGDWVIPGFLLIGIGIGFLTGQIAAFTLIGLGAGFLVVLLAMLKKRERK
ncbi:MAG: hypothetical protein ABIH37_00040 [archaeon]